MTAQPLRLSVIRRVDGVLLGSMPARVGIVTSLGEIERVNDVSLNLRGFGRANPRSCIVYSGEARRHGWPKGPSDEQRPVEPPPVREPLAALVETRAGTARGRASYATPCGRWVITPFDDGSAGRGAMVPDGWIVEDTRADGGPRARSRHDRRTLTEIRACLAKNSGATAGPITRKTGAK